MRKSNGLLVLFALLIGAVAGGWAVYTYKPLPEGKVIANKTAIDSLNAFIIFADSVKSLDLSPDTISIRDTIYIDSVRYVTTTPEISDSVIFDSIIVDQEINAWVKIMIEGHVEDISIEWRYKPIVHTISTTIEKPIYTPVITTINKDVIKYSTGHYLSAAMGGNAKMFTFGVDYDIVKKDYIYGLQYRRYGDQNVYGFKIGMNLRTLFKF